MTPDQIRTEVRSQLEEVIELIMDAKAALRLQIHATEALERRLGSLYRALAPKPPEDVPEAPEDPLAKVQTMGQGR